MTITIHGIYGGIDPAQSQKSIRESFAAHCDETILGYHVIDAVGCLSIGHTSLGTTANAALTMAKAEESVVGHYRYAIEPNRGLWLIDIYDGGVSPIESDTKPSMSEAIKHARQRLLSLAAKHYSTVS